VVIVRWFVSEALGAKIGKKSRPAGREEVNAACCYVKDPDVMNAKTINGLVYAGLAFHNY
jgi:hypothetical protein